MSNHADSHTPSREQSYNRLSAMSLNSLRHYASHFLGLPSTDRQNKHDLVLWFLQNSSQHILNLILSFAESRDVREDRTRRKPVRAPVDDDDSERDVVRVRCEHQPPNPSVFLELPSDAEIKTCYRAFYESTSNARLSSSVCGVCGRQAFYDSDQLQWFSLQRIPNRRRLVPCFSNRLPLK
ncbi:hypothetical protein F5887DRAFT_1052878 [Amanita rubescens]|nr:hypothetical protein F5887DRAFT_1052878 [Amanita rubescens]